MATRKRNNLDSLSNLPPSNPSRTYKGDNTTELPDEPSTDDTNRLVVALERINTTLERIADTLDGGNTELESIAAKLEGSEHELQSLVEYVKDIGSELGSIRNR